MNTRYLVPLALGVIAVACLSIVAFAQPLGLPPTVPLGRGPKYDKYVASLEDANGTRCGHVIFNTNPEDDGLYEFEVDVDDCLTLANRTVEVQLDGVVIGELSIDEAGNGKATFYVDAVSTDSDVSVDGGALTSGDWRLWAKTRGPK